MNDREKFEAWARSVFCGYTYSMSNDREGGIITYDNEEIDSAHMGWQACAESKQAELDKANEEIAGLKKQCNAYRLKDCPNALRDHKNYTWDNPLIVRNGDTTHYSYTIPYVKEP